jgi:antitoxin (DNA-binding transcriptional repressor) of toxin-antitoxin stability system
MRSVRRRRPARGQSFKPPPLSARIISQDFSRAKREAKSGPVVITERGRPANVLVAYDEYRGLVGRPQSILEGLAMDIELDLPERRIEPFRAIHLG